MKVRNDFVTNSSSSSYIIAYKKMPEFDDETITKYPFLRNYSKLIESVLFTEGCSDTTSGESFSTKEEWDKNFISEYGWKDNTTIEEIIEDDSYTKDEYDKAISALNDGFCIIKKSVDYCDTYCANMIEELAKDEENFIILRDE